MRACVRLIVPRLCSRHTCPTSKPGGSMTPPAHPGCLCRVAPPVTPRGPHGPGRADFPHPVLRAAASSRFEACASPRTSPATRVALLSERGCEWLVSTMSLPSGPARARMPRRRPLLRGVPWVGSPTSSLVLRRYDSSTPRPPSLCLERPFRLSGDDEISQVPGQPLRTCHGLRPRWAGLAEVPGYAPCVLTKPVLPSASTNASATTT
jgi:hypothetical protein